MDPDQATPVFGRMHSCVDGQALKCELIGMLVEETLAKKNAVIRNINPPQESSPWAVVQKSVVLALVI